MPCVRSDIGREVERLFLTGMSYPEIRSVTGLSADSVAGFIYRARKAGRIPKPVRIISYEHRRSSHKRRGTIADVLDVLSADQRKLLVNHAIDKGYATMAEVIGDIVLEAMEDEDLI